MLSRSEVDFRELVEVMMTVTDGLREYISQRYGAVSRAKALGTYCAFEQETPNYLSFFLSTKVFYTQKVPQRYFFLEIYDTRLDSSDPESWYVYFVDQPEARGVDGLAAVLLEHFIAFYEDHLKPPTERQWPQRNYVEE